MVHSTIGYNRAKKKKKGIHGVMPLKFFNITGSGNVLNIVDAGNNVRQDANDPPPALDGFVIANG